MEAYSKVIKDRESTPDAEQEQVKQTVATPALESAGDNTESSTRRKQAASKVVSSFVEQARRQEYTQGDTTNDEKLLQLCEIFADEPVETVKSFLVASGYNTEMAASALSNKSASTASASTSSSAVQGPICRSCGLIHPPRHSMGQYRPATQPERASSNAQLAQSYGQDPASPSGLGSELQGIGPSA